MSRDKGNRAAAWACRYLSNWWPSIEATPNSLPGRDILGTPSVCWEVKTSPHWRSAWLAQVVSYAAPGELPVVLYFPPGTGAAHAADALCVIRLRDLMPALVDAGYAPAPHAPVTPGHDSASEATGP